MTSTTAKHPAIQPAALSEADAAVYVGKSRAYLKKSRRFGTGPAYVRHGRAITYRIRDLDDFLLRHVVRPAEG